MVALLHYLFITPLCFFKNELFLVPVMFLLLFREIAMPCSPAATAPFICLPSSSHALSMSVNKDYI